MKIRLMRLPCSKLLGLQFLKGWCVTETIRRHLVQVCCLLLNVPPAKDLSSQIPMESGLRALSKFVQFFNFVSVLRFRLRRQCPCRSLLAVFSAAAMTICSISTSGEGFSAEAP